MSDRAKQTGARFPVGKIAIFRALFLGDLICALPALRALREHFPQAEITLIGLPWAEDFVRRAPTIDRLAVFCGYEGIQEVPYRRARTTAFLRAAQAERYDLALQMHGNGTISNGFVAALGARASLGFRQGADARLTDSLPYQPDEHEILRWLRLAQHAGCSFGAGGREITDAGCIDALDLPVTPAEEAQAAALLATAPALSGPLIGIHPGSKEAARRWPAERFAALADALIERHGARVVLTGSAGERDLTGAVARAMRFPALDLAGATDLGVFAATIGALDLLVTNDTGASHVAAARRARSVVLFGPSRPEQWGPLDRRRHRLIDATALAGGSLDPHAALRDLPVEAVLAACEEMLTAGDTVRDIALGAGTPLT